LRAALHLLQRPSQSCSRVGRRRALIDSLHAAAESAGPQYHAVINDVLSEAESRDAIRNALATVAADAVKEGLLQVLATRHSDMAVVGRLTASGEEPGREVQAGQASFSMPAILWLTVAYENFPEAVMANARFGGESAVRAVFIGLLIAARDVLGSVNDDALAASRSALPAQAFNDAVRLLDKPWRLCTLPGLCRGSKYFRGRRRMHGVVVEAAVETLEPLGNRLRYRIFTSIDVSMHLGVNMSLAATARMESDSSSMVCLARYFQFTTVHGRHAPFGLWPAEALCEFSHRSPVAKDSFDVLLPEPLEYIIGGVMIHTQDGAIDIRLPRLAIRRHERPEPPRWASACTQVGSVRFPNGEWLTNEEVGRTSVAL